MPFSLVGWSESQDSAVLIEVAALADPHLTSVGDIVRVPQFASHLVGLYALGLNVTRAQLRSPSLRRILNLEVMPLDRFALPSTPLPIAMFPLSPIPLDVDEDITALAAEDAVGAIRTSIFAFLADGPFEPITGQIFTVRATAAVTLGVGIWTNAALTFDQQLPAGEYQIVGATFRSTNLVAFRFVFPGGASRPGGIGNLAVNAVINAGQRRGGWGEWGRFRHTVPPTVDFLAFVADAAEAGEIDLIKVA